MAYVCVLSSLVIVMFYVHLIYFQARLHDCIRCGLSFKTRSAMIGHVRKVHDKMYQPKERLFECEECNKKFYKKFHLQRHIRVHTGSNSVCLI